MNKKLLELLRRLDDERIVSLKERFENSPLMIRFLDFLLELDGKNFKSREAVKTLYVADQGEFPFEILQNRYFKLRKKLLEAIEEVEDPVPREAVLLTTHELLFYEARKHIASNEIKEATQILSKLKDYCYRINLFEMIPEVLNKLIYCNRVFHLLKEEEKLLGEMEKAIILQHAWQKLDWHFKVAFKNRYYSIGYETVKADIQKIRLIAEKYSEWPRFKLAYHYVAFSLGASFGGNKQHAISRHFNRLKELRESNPQMPLFDTGPNYEIKAANMLKSVESMFYWRIKQFDKAYAAMLEGWEITQKHKDVFPALSAAQYNNRMTLEIRTGRFSEAKKTVKDLIDFLKENKIHDKLPDAYADMAFIQVMMWPEVPFQNMEYMMRNVQKALEESRKHGPLQREGSLRSLLASMYFIDGAYEMAEKTMDHSVLKTYLKEFGFPELANLYRLPATKFSNAVERRSAYRKFLGGTKKKVHFSKKADSNQKRPVLIPIND